MDKPVEKIATRNMFYDEKGKHRRTKKEILDETGNIRKKCKVIRKGEVYEQNLFTKKNELFKADGFLDEVKRSIELYGNNPSFLVGIIRLAIKALELLISKVLLEAAKEAERVVDNV